MTQTFGIAPADIRWLWLIMGVALVAVAVATTVVGLAIRGARSSQFEVSDEGLRLRGDFYGRLIPAAELRPAEARRLDFDREPERLPGRRTLGTGTRGYQSGWFRLRNGERALLYLTDRGRAVYVPTTAGYGVIVSPSDPEGFLSALRAMRR